MKSSNSFDFYAAVPLLILFLSLGTYHLTASEVSTIIPALAVGIIYLLTREQEESAWNTIKTTLVVGSVYLVGFWILHTLQAPSSPWGIIGWITFSSIVTIFAIASPIADKVRMFSRTYWDVLLQFLMILTCASHVYLYWGTFIAWIPLAAFVAYEYLIDGLDSNWYTDMDHVFIFTTAGIIGAASSLTQFWHLGVLGYELWQIVAAIAGAAIIILSFILIRKAVIKRRQTKEKKNREIQAEKEEQERLRLKREKAIEEENARNQHLNEVSEKLLKEETVSVDDVYELAKAGWKIPNEVIAKIDFRQLFLISEVKNQIVWKGNQLDVIFAELEAFFITCYDDELLKKTIEHCLQLKDLSNYIGYEALRRSLIQLGVTGQHVQLPEASEKKQEQITN